MGGTMIRDFNDLIQARNEAIKIHSAWKQRTMASDLVIRHKWSTLWADLTTSVEDPLVEDLYTEALEDKAYTASGIHPQIIVAPETSTSGDRGEKKAAKRRKVFATYALNSRFSVMKVLWFLDWWKDGAGYAMPWTDFHMSPRHPWFIRQNPRHVFPMAHDSRGNLTAGLIAKMRRFIDVVNDYGDNEAVQRIRFSRLRTGRDMTEAVEEIWWYDTKQWAMALYDAPYSPQLGNFRYVAPTRFVPESAAAVGSFVLAPEKHKMSRCPLVEMKRARSDDEYWGALDVMLPQMKHAHNLMARIMKDVEMNLFAPTLAEGILNIEDWGPDAMLLGDGSGRARIEKIRDPINFEAMQLVGGQLEGARGSAKYPQQRSGDPGASISSAKGTNVLMGAFNSEQAVAQNDFADFTQNILEVTAEFDEKWCGGRKRIMGFDQGEAYSAIYDPRTMFNTVKDHQAGVLGDYRVLVTYGGGLGLDQASYLIQLATAMNLKGMSRRTFMMKSGLVDNVIAEEGDMLMEQIIDAFQAFMGQQALQAGNMDPMIKIVNMLDDQSETARSAVMKVVKETFAVPTQTGGGVSGPGPVDVIKQARSLASGGIPGNAEGQPSNPGIGPALAGMLPGDVRRAMSETQPGGTSA